jgi:Methyltransferase domain
MLEKTLAMLAHVQPGTYLPDDVECHDPAELEALGLLLQRLIYSPSSIRRLLQQKFGVTITRADAYGEIPSIAELERSFASPSLLTLEGIFPDNGEMVAELDRLMKVSHEFDPPLTSSGPGDYAWQNGEFSFSDAMAYYAMIRTRRPRTIIEIGGGWHTRIAQMACARNGMGRIVCIEPNPGAFLEALEGIELVRRRVQAVETEFFNGLLRDGDMLFVDSTHTVRHDGDCLHIYLRILPGMDASISVQAHDIALPDALSIEQMRDRQIFWGEQYLLYAYMCGNPRTRAIYGSRYHARHNPEMLDRFMHGRYRAGGASFWFEQMRG